MFQGRKNISAELIKRRISAIIRTNDQDLAAKAIDSVIEAGFKTVEFTLTTPGSLNLISSFSAKYKDVLIGAGTVMSVKSAQDAVKAGARFLVSPTFNKDVVSTANKLDVVSIAGTYTANEMESAHNAGSDFVKLFPAPGNLSEYISFLLGPLPHLKIIPTAGVNYENMLPILRAGAAGMGFTNSLFHAQDMKNHNFLSIKNRAGKIVQRLANYIY